MIRLSNSECIRTRIAPENKLFCPCLLKSLLPKKNVFLNLGCLGITRIRRKQEYDEPVL